MNTDRPMQEPGPSPNDGGPSTEGAPINEAEAIARLQQTDDPSAQYYAAWWLGRMRSEHPEAVPLLCQALRQRQPRQPDAGVEANAVARNAARALGLLRAKAAVADLLATLEDDDHGLRDVAARALGDIQAPEAVPALCRRLSTGLEGAGAPEEGSPRLREPCESLLEALGAIGDNTPEVLKVITPFTEHPRPLIRSAACRALLQLTGDSCWATPLEELLRHPQLQVRRAALMDLGAVGWRPALPAIEATLAENSLKLIALRGLAEHPREPNDSESLDRGVDPLVIVLNAMDALL